MNIPLIGRVIALVAFVLFFTSCAAPRGIEPIDEDSGSAMSICEAAENSSLQVGATLRLRAEYNTDGSTYTYLLDPECGKAGVLQVFGPADSRMPDWVEFEAKQREVCNSRGASYICAFSQLVEVAVEIVLYEEEKYARINSIVIIE